MNSSRQALIHSGNKSETISENQPLPSLAAGISDWQLYMAGIIALALTSNRWNLAMMGWLAFVPFLIASLRVANRRAGLVFLIVMTCGVTLQVMKIITDPLPFAMASCLGFLAVLLCRVCFCYGVF